MINENEAPPVGTKCDAYVGMDTRSMKNPVVARCKNTATVTAFCKVTKFETWLCKSCYDLMKTAGKIHD